MYDIIIHIFQVMYRLAVMQLFHGMDLILNLKTIKIILLRLL